MRLCARPAILQASPKAARCPGERESRSASPVARAPAGARARRIRPQPPPGEPLRSRLARSASARLRAQVLSYPLVGISLRRYRATAVWGLLLNIGEETCVLGEGPGQDPAPWSVLARACPQYLLL